MYENLGRELVQPAGSRGGRRVGGSGIFSTASEGVSTPSGGCRGHVGTGVSSFDRLLSSVSLLLTRSKNEMYVIIIILKRKVLMEVKIYLNGCKWEYPTICCGIGDYQHANSSGAMSGKSADTVELYYTIT